MSIFLSSYWCSSSDPVGFLVKLCAVCNFEENSTCHWSFETTDSQDQKNVSKNFRIIVGDKLTAGTFISGSRKGDIVGHTMTPKSEHFAYYNSTDKHNYAALIVSPYYQYASPTCELTFSYRLFGIAGAAIMVTTQHREQDYAYDDLSSDPNQDEANEDWVTPTSLKTIRAQSSYSAPWKTETIHIGHITFPTRIRIECHTGNQRTEPRGVDKDLQSVECYIDDITMGKCDEELYDDSSCESQRVPKYLCTKSGRRKCINQDQLCDMQIDCAGGEDEDPELHNCTQVPRGARCNFEQPVTEDNPIGCRGWSLTSYIRDEGKSDTHLLHNINSTIAHNFTEIDKAVPIKDHTYGTHNASGHFLFFSYPLKEDKTVHKYTYMISPMFPPTSPALYDPTSSIYGTCKLQFFYCSYGAGTPSFMVTLQSTDGQTPKVLWNPTKEPYERTYYCEWNKVSIDIPPQKGQYFLKITVSKLFHTSTSFAVDDLSLSPNCFLESDSWKDRVIPYVYNITSCGHTGGSPPNGTVCGNHYNKTASDTNTNVVTHGYQSWIAPITAEYRIELYGASGGKIPHQKVNNNGGRLVTIAKLSQASELKVLVGQKGVSPCDKKPPKMQLTEKLSHAYSYTCEDYNDPDNSMEIDPIDLVYLPGTGGGGATWVQKNGQTILIAGGGGGVFPGASEAVMPIGGLMIDRRRNISLPQRSTTDWMSGTGSSIEGRPPQFFNCSQCVHMSGNKTYGGVCDGVNLLWNNVGGFGGGGASCGPGGGGGAGYIGGFGGSKTHGSGGFSYVANEDLRFLVEAGENPNDGFVLIYPCKLNCPVNATCQFKDPAKDTKVTMSCVCPGGSEVAESGVCPDEFQEKPLTQDYLNLDMRVVFLCFVLLALMIMICCVGCFLSQRRLKKWQISQEAEQMRIERMNRGLMAGLMDEHDMNNPIYDLGRLQELNHIPRNCITLKCRLGQGAFGEVYEGVFCTSEAAIPAAVKTLHVSSTQQAFEDFETEALIMSKFRHENIVEFFGVSFDAIPRFIVLELLAGGDLKTFLRDSRPKSTNPMDTKLQLIDLFDMALDVARGCLFLEENRFIHRDLAARNCLLTHREPGRKVKIADFGMARDIYKADYYRKGGKALLPVKWMPPEAFLDGLFTSKTDVWSYGVLLWEIFSLGFIPYPGRGNQEVMDMIMSGGRLDSPNGLPEEIYALMVQCWNTDECCRPGFKEIVTWLEDECENPIVKACPVPMIIHKLGLTVKIHDSHNPFLEPADSTLPSSATSQATVSTMVGSTNSDMFQSINYAMPTTGNGVNYICEPYRSKCHEANRLTQQLPQLPDLRTLPTFSPATGASVMPPLGRQESLQDDEESLIAQNNARSIYQNPNPPSPSNHQNLPTLDQQAPGSRQPILDQASTEQFPNSTPDSARQKLLSDSQIL
ncbi:hypothetical protein L596_021543 [Steinernema carpocapsae]|uniref:Tyrosine-protein kinase receptor n=1 Tax=Steinernema carpocapsae TaxID=34508 RepID=A0A4U5MJ52_STECR|nr:hypothetical protein L596_021543 [Steinernema carpocapsae]